MSVLSRQRPILPSDPNLSFRTVPVLIESSASAYRIPHVDEWAVINAWWRRFATENELFQHWGWSKETAGREIKLQQTGKRLPDPNGLFDVQGNAMEVCFGGELDNDNWIVLNKYYFSGITYNMKTVAVRNALYTSVQPSNFIREEISFRLVKSLPVP